MMEVYPKIQTLFRRDLDGSLTGQKGKMIKGKWTTPELEYLAGNKWEFTEKVDGTNIRVGYRPVVASKDGFKPLIEFGGRTDRAVIPGPLLEALDTMFTYERFAEIFPDIDASGITLFGEGYGPKIQGGGKYREDHSFVLFDVKIDRWFLNRESVNDIASKLGIDSVPVIGCGTLNDAINIVGEGMESSWGGFEAEGLVCRPAIPLFDRKGDRIITKVKSVDFR